MVQTLLKNAFREPSLMSLPLHHQRKLKQHWQMLRSLGNEYRGDTIHKRAAKKKTKAKKARKLIMKKAENNTEDLR